MQLLVVERMGWYVLATCCLAGPEVGNAIAGTLIVCWAGMPAEQLPLLHAWVATQLSCCSVVAQ